MSETLQLHVLGTRVEIEIAGDGAALATAAVREAWGELVLPGAADADGRGAGEAEPEVAAEIVADGPLHFTVGDEQETHQFMDSLSSRATLAGIDARSGELLMLHAAGFAHPDTGTVIACVAPSGTGKTTISGAAAGHLHYVTDETVAVEADGTVVRYPKPLSVKQTGEGWVPKLQRAPGSLGLTVAPEAGLRLGGIVLLRRLRDGEVDAAGAGAGAADQLAEPRLEPVDLFDAIIELVPELSYLGRMQHPLQRIAAAVLQTGGARRLVYREAGEAIHLLAAHAGTQEAGTWTEPAGGAGGALDASRLETERWEAAIGGRAGRVLGAEASSADPAGEPHTELRLAAELDDLLVDPERGQALIFSANTVRLISSIAAATLLAARNGITETELRDVLHALFGEPPAGNDPIAETVRALEAEGLVGRGALDAALK